MAGCLSRICFIVSRFENETLEAVESLSAGSLIAGRYRVERVLGRGGAGAAYLCVDRQAGGERCTVKLLVSDAPGAAATIRAEFRLLVRLRHPHLVHVIDVGVDAGTGRPYYAARFVEGATLAEAGRSWGEVEQALIDACAALAHLHALGLRHGDVKPENLVVGPDGRGTLIDLGAAAPFGPLEVLSGTPGFLAPELLAGEAADQRADLYAFGVALDRIRARVGAPPEVAGLIERLCSPAPADRPADARAVIAALGGEPEAALPVVVPSHLVGRARELAALHALDAAGAGPVLWFWGPAGIGKTRLIEEARAIGMAAVDDAHLLGEAERAALVSGGAAVVASRDPMEGVDCWRLAPLSDHEMRQWLGGAFAEELVDEVVKVARGVPGVAARIVSAAAKGEVGIGRLRELGERTGDGKQETGNRKQEMSAGEALEAARERAARGEHREALRMVARCLRTRPEEGIAREARVVAGEAYARMGDVRRAERVLGRLGREARVANQLAIALIKQGAYGRAAEVAEAALAGAGSALAAELHCDLALAASYLGEAGQARRAIERAHAADRAPAARTAVRIAAAEATIEYRAGNPVGALPGYRRALDLAIEHRLDDSAVNQAMNYGATSHQIGDWGQALAAYERGLRVATAGGLGSARARLLHNLGALYADIGQLDLAEDALARACRLADEQALDFVAGSARLYAAEVARARARGDRAAELLAAAEAILARAGAARELCEVAIERAALLLSAGRAGEAAGQAEEAAARAAGLGARDLVARAQLWLGRARQADAPQGALAALERAAAEAEAAGHRLLQAEIAEALAATADALGSPNLARAHRERALIVWERLAATLPDTFRAPFREQRIPAPAPAAAPPAADGPSAADWKRLVLVNRRLNSAMTTALVLQEALDAALDLTGGERGFLILARPGGLEVPVARNLDREQIGRSHLKFSRGIAESVVASGSPVVAVDAGADHRFAGNQSVHAMRLQSVLCVPITAPDGVIGAVYIDNRFRRGGFGEREVELLAALADQAALALTRARLTDELAARTRELEEERQQVDALMQKQQSEIVELEEELGRTRMLAVRHDYSELVGQSAALRQVLATLDRVTASEVTVLIRGESGTGKELAARALHRNGPRAAGPFAALNCGALPESLLEAELFGHERGAFTGAGAARPGLFAAARGGTVFLDELGEMSLAMQVKLLRVLQEREVRPLGGAATIPVDVRVVCATNRDLEAEVAAGRFRQDLYYRVAVVTVEMPPLRRRLEDLPLIADAILARVAGDLGREPPRLSAAALRALLQHDWPGNVRELENALTKACLMADGREIRPRDLSLPQAAPRRRRRGAVGRREILAALEAHGGNASRAALALGIGRATLYRKLGKPTRS